MGSDQESGLRRTLFVNLAQDSQDDIVLVAKALSSPTRLQILEHLQVKDANVSEIAEALQLPRATANLHITSLAEAGLIRFETVSAKRGIQKLCKRNHDIVVIHIPKNNEVDSKNRIVTEMPIGNYVDYQVSPTCGLANEFDYIGHTDDAASFYEPKRTTAQIIWLGQGHLEYRFPYRPEGDRSPQRLKISMELCSEAFAHHLDWPSDIFLEINNVLIGAWKSPADLGGKRGRLTPEWWNIEDSQYGLLKTWRVDAEGATLDGDRFSDITLDDLSLNQNDFIKVCIGVRPDAANVGGLNLFGEKFGNHPQGIILELNF
jgi:predicted transcriptional regulator